MPRAKAWSAEILRIISNVERFEDERLSRSDVERIFGVGRTQADELISTAGGKIQPGERMKSVSRQALLDYLRFSDAGAAARREADRRAQLAKRLQSAQKDAKARSVVIYEAEQVDRIEAAQRAVLADLPGVSIEPGELRIVFSSAHNLVEQLYRLSQAIGNEYDAFREMAESSDES